MHRFSQSGNQQICFHISVLFLLFDSLGKGSPGLQLVMGLKPLDLCLLEACLDVAGLTLHAQTDRKQCQ